MLKYILKRVIISVPVLLGMVLLIFIMLNVIPGNPIAVMQKEKVKPEVVERISENMHLNDPVPVRYFRYVAGLFRGDFGISYRMNRPVSTIIAQAFPNTLRLAIMAALFSWIVGIPLGILSAVRKDRAVDRLFMGFSLFGVSMPVFWIGLILQNLLKEVLPISGADSLKSMILPMIVLGWASAGRIARMTRSNLLEVIGNDYMRTASAKGLLFPRAIVSHALKNALMPVVTLMAIQIADLLSGAVITETIFSINGIGRLSVVAINSRDMPLLQGTVIFTAALIIAGNLLADVLYSVIDPRIRIDS
jgi:peptide/nickel transport system permease protein